MADLTGSQVRMGRAALRWSIAELARRAGVGLSTIQIIEAKDEIPSIASGVSQTRKYREAARAASVEAIRVAMNGAGVTFLTDDGHGAGVRCQLKGRRRK
jgi:DNA-binding XRE family transcriptional regulator